jgi:hypothetical protein
MVTMFKGINDYIATRRFKQQVERDIDIVLAACTPLDWQEAAPAEPAVAVHCLHPLDKLIIVQGKFIECAICKDEVTMDQAKARYEARDAEANRRPDLSR